MYLIERDKEITEDILRQFLMKFQGKDVPKLQKYKNYYDGKQAILSKVSKDETKQYAKIVTNFTKYITDSYAGYLTGIPVQYDNDDFEDVIDILKYNDYVQEDAGLLTDALIYGRAFEINYVQPDGVQRFRTLDPRTCIPVYTNDLNNDLEYVIRFWEYELDANNQPMYMVEVYGTKTVKRYHSNAGFMSFWFIEEVPHFYGQCPVTVLSLNKDEKSIFDQVITLQDAYNEVLSGSVDDFNAFADAYLVLKGMTADEEDLIGMKQNRVLMMDADCSADYLTKTINDVQVTNLLTNFKDNIHKIANCPDFTDEKFMAQSGVAIRYKLVGFENAASSIESNMRKALQRRIEIICSIISLTDTERLWRDVDITFTRNLPTDMSDTVNMVNSLRGLVSTRTLLQLLPFVTDVDAELEELKAEKEENMELYSFSRPTEEVTEDEQLLDQ